MSATRSWAIYYQNQAAQARREGSPRGIYAQALCDMHYFVDKMRRESRGTCLPK